MLRKSSTFERLSCFKSWKVKVESKEIEWVSEWVWERERERERDRETEWMTEWMSEWVREREREREWLENDKPKFKLVIAFSQCSEIQYYWLRTILKTEKFFQKFGGIKWPFFTQSFNHIAWVMSAPVRLQSIHF